MKKIHQLTLLFVLVLLVAASCGSKNDEELPSAGPCSGTAGPLFLDARTVIRDNCAISGCHSGVNATGNLNFLDNCTIVAQASRIKQRAVDFAGTPSQMPPPPSPPLSLADRQKITDWVAAGGRFTD